MMESLNFVDVILIIIFCVSIIIGFGRGFIAEFLALATLIVAFIIAINFAVPLADQLITHPTVHNAVQQAAGNSNNPNVQSSASLVAIAFSFTALFIGTLFVGFIVRVLINLAFQSGFLGFGNRLLGALFGAARGYLYLLFIIFVITLTPFSDQSWWKQSYLVNLYQPQVVWLSNKVSPTIQGAVEQMKTKVSATIQKVGNQIESILGRL